VSFDPVPIAIGNGAVLQDDVFRVFANAATRDSEGVVLPGQFKTTALGSPGAAVSIAPGGLVVRNAQKTGESYIGRAQTATQVSISPNNGGSTRRDLVLARIIDPDYSPWQPSGTPGAPNTSVPNGPYFEPYVLSGVGAVTSAAQAGITYSAVALARVDMPAGAQTVQSGYITDLRQLAQPRIGFAYDVQTVASSQQLLVTDTTAKDWPLNSLQVYVPRWATHAQVGITLLTVGTDGNASDFSPACTWAGPPWSAPPGTTTAAAPTTTPVSRSSRSRCTASSTWWPRRTRSSPSSRRRSAPSPATPAWWSWTPPAWLSST
jgi:hypothetical protein